MSFEKQVAFPSFSNLHTLSYSSQVVNIRRWLADISELLDANIQFPVLSDQDGDIFAHLDLIEKQSLLQTPNQSSKTPTIVSNASYLIDLDTRIQILTYSPPAVGRNLYETLRTYDALQLSLFHSVVTPCNWANGEDVMVSNQLSSQVAFDMFPQGFVEIKVLFLFCFLFFNVCL